VVDLSHAFYAEYFADMLPKVHKFIRARFPSGQAEDLANETMLTLWRKAIPVPVDESELRQLRQLTYKIALGHVLNAQRKHARELEAVEHVVLRIVPGADPTFEAIVPMALAQAIAQLEFNDRQAINLLIAGFGTGEIADILGISAKAASMRLARCRARLDRKLTAVGDDQEEVSEGVRSRQYP
jgi:RNA polymerase sigma-70 factor (ECF subfamily)